ncbi:MAG TPA: hypothetical protein VFN09_04265 [Rhodanobacteraceae bacterium]|nr:hypothetical protein [Rhodanobacteraceae bacterium]
MRHTLCPRHTPPSRRVLAASLALVLGLGGVLDAAAMPPGTTASVRMPGEHSLELLASLQRAPSGWLENASEQELALAIVTGDVPSHWSASTTATVHQVSNCNDSGAGSLRAVIASSSVVSGDTVSIKGLDCDFALASPIPIDQDTLTIEGDVLGYGELDSVITAAPGNQSGLLRHSGTGTLYLRSLRIEDGKKYKSDDDKYAAGACISSTGNVSLSSSLVRGCVARNNGSGGARGGAVAAAGVVTLLHSSVLDNDAYVLNGRALGGGLFAAGGVGMKYSTLWGNTAYVADAGSGAGYGGAIYAGTDGFSGNSIIQRSTLAFNSADFAGALYVREGSVDINTTTIHGNKSAHSNAMSGAVMLLEPVSALIRNSTFTRNKNQGAVHPGGLGVRLPHGTVTLESSIFSGNTGLAGQPNDLLKIPNSPAFAGSHNLIGEAGASLVPADTIRQINTPMTDFSQHGDTYGAIPAAGSWAFNLGAFDAGPLDPETDQSEAPRRVGTGVDIGALESDALFIGRFEDPPLY